jgi:hypothetical protein
MATIIKAGNATTGVNITGDATGNLQLNTGPSAGTPGMLIDTNQYVYGYTAGQSNGGLIEARQFYRLNANSAGGTNSGTRQGIFTSGQSTASSITLTTLTVGGTISGTFAVGQLISGPNVTTDTYITAVLGANQYTVSISQTAASAAINSYSGVNLASSTVYAFECKYFLQKSAGTSNHTVGFSFGGNATLNNIVWGGQCWNNGSNTVPVTTNNFVGWQFSNANQVFTSNISTSGAWLMATFEGTVSILAGGTFIPAYTLSAAPGGAYFLTTGTYFNIYPVGAAGSNTVIGNWV